MQHTGLTPKFSSFLIRACSSSACISLFMLEFLFKALVFTLGFCSGAGSGFFSTTFLSDWLLESVKDISVSQSSCSGHSWSNYRQQRGNKRIQWACIWQFSHEASNHRWSWVDVTAEEENVSKFICQQQGNKMMNGHDDDSITEYTQAKSWLSKML